MECEHITKQILPAVRISVAEALAKKGLTQMQIAARLGIAQAAVSKYLTGKYSHGIKELSERLTRSGLNDKIVSEALAGKPVAEINSLIDALCEKLVLEEQR
ncbi:MAG: transcriptional regulator [Candidatus Micrarchaeia archaeon]